MTPKDIVLSQMNSTLFLFETFIKDFSDADARYQPFEGANHLNWILVHLAVTEDHIIHRLTGQPKRLSQTLHDTYGGGRPCRADDGMTKAEAWKVFAESHRRTVEFIQSFPESRYGEKSPEGTPPIFPTVGDMIGLFGSHPYWHFGQLSVNRRGLKKPLIFG